MAVLQRKLSGKQDALLGYCISDKKIMGKYPVVEPTGCITDTVLGITFKVSNADLFWLDQYETTAYKRILALLKSGAKAWVYIENTT